MVLVGSAAADNERVVSKVGAGGSWVPVGSAAADNNKGVVIGVGTLVGDLGWGFWSGRHI